MHLSAAEITQAISKIRAKYNKLVNEYKKSPVLIENFEQRYSSVLHSRNDLDAFIIGEIEAVEELLNREQAKYNSDLLKNVENAEKKKQEQAKEAERKNSAQQIMEENLNKIRKYPAIDMGQDAMEDITRLLGAVRELINDYYPALVAIFREYHHLLSAERVMRFYDGMITQYDYKGIPPIARRYKDLLGASIHNQQKLDYEYRYILQETAFLLNDISDCLEEIKKANEIPSPNQKIQVVSSKFFIISEKYKKTFNGKKFSDAFTLVADFVENILLDFRLRGIRRHIK